MTQDRDASSPIRLKNTISKIQSGFWGDEPDGENDVICLRVADFNRDDFTINDSKLTLRSISQKDKLPRILKHGDLLIEKSGGGENQPVGTVAFFNKNYEAISSNFLSLLRPTSNHDGRFLCYLFASLYSSRINTKSIKQTTGIQNIDLESYLNEKAVIPPLPIQKAIAAYLDKETTRIDTLIAKKERQIELLKEKRQAIITRAITKGLDPDAKMKDSGVEWIGEIPEGWEVGKLKHVCSHIVDCPHSTPEYTEDGEYPAIRTADINLGILDLTYAKRVNEKTYRERVLRLAPKVGDIIYSREGERFGMAGMVPEGATICLGQRVMQLRIESKNSDGYFLWTLNSECCYNQAKVEIYGSTSPHVNVETISNFTVPIPPLYIQNIISSWIMANIVKVDKTILMIVKSIEKLREYRSSLITAAVSGQIEVEIP
jgi:type I restriction enzyme S subunit